jgi:hypothetical protein
MAGDRRIAGDEELEADLRRPRIALGLVAGLDAPQLDRRVVVQDHCRGSGVERRPRHLRNLHEELLIGLSERIRGSPHGNRLAGFPRREGDGALREYAGHEVRREGTVGLHPPGQDLRLRELARTDHLEQILGPAD